MELLKEQVENYTYKIVYLSNEIETVIGKCNEYKEAFSIINAFIKRELQAIPSNYRATHFDGYVRLINGDYTFRLYNIKD